MDAIIQQLQADFQALQVRTTASENRNQALEAAVNALQNLLNNNQNVRTRSQLPPKFAGNKDRNADSDALLSWEFDLMAHLEYARIVDPAEQLRLTVTLLDGPAKLCWRNHVTNTTDPATGLATNARCQNLHQLVTNILRPEFLSVNHVQTARDELSQCVQVGTVTEYIYRFRQICLRIPNLTADEKLDKFRRGLNDELQYQLALNPPANFEAYCAAAERIASARRASSHHRTSERTYSSSRSDRSESGPSPMEINTLRTRQAPAPARPYVNNLYQNSPRQRDARYNSPARHVSFDAASTSRSPPRSAMSRADSPRTIRYTNLTDQEKEELLAKNACFYCRKVGHQAHDCPARRAPVYRR